MNESTTLSSNSRPATRADWTNLLRTLGIKPSRSMGQNFLVEPDVVRHIADAAGVCAGSHVVEIGPGLGILTRELLARGCTVTGIELDDELARFLVRELRQEPRFSLVRHDARFVDVEGVTGTDPYRVVANLPYSVATVIIRHFVESPHPPVQLTVMVQREVAARMTAAPPDMSLLGLATQFSTEPEMNFIVKPAAFVPPPKVESAVMTLDVRTHLPLDQIEREWMFTLATHAFQRRRKTITNGLAQGLGREKPVIQAYLASAGIQPMRRPETLAVDDWVTLAQAIPEQV